MPGTTFIPGPGDTGVSGTLRSAGALSDILNQNALAKAQVQASAANAQESLARAAQIGALTGQQNIINQFLPQTTMLQQQSEEEQLRQQQIQSEVAARQNDMAKQAAKDWSTSVLPALYPPDVASHLKNSLEGQMYQQMLQQQQETEMLKGHNELYQSLAGKADAWAKEQENTTASKLLGTMYTAQGHVAGEQVRGEGAAQIHAQSAKDIATFNAQSKETLQEQTQQFQTNLAKLRAAQNSTRSGSALDSEIADMLRTGQATGDAGMVGDALMIMAARSNKGIIPMKGGGFDANTGETIPQEVDVDKLKALAQQFISKGPSTRPSTQPSPSQKIRVRRITDNAVGTIDPGDFNPSLYEKLP